MKSKWKLVIAQGSSLHATCQQKHLELWAIQFHSLQRKEWTNTTVTQPKNDDCKNVTLKYPTSKFTLKMSQIKIRTEKVKCTKKIRIATTTKHIKRGPSWKLEGAACKMEERRAQLEAGGRGVQAGGKEGPAGSWRARSVSADCLRASLK